MFAAPAGAALYLGPYGLVGPSGLTSGQDRTALLGRDAHPPHIEPEDLTPDPGDAPPSQPVKPRHLA